MGPAKVSRTITKIRIKGYEDRQQHEEVPSSVKKEKISDLGPIWTNDELMCFYKAYHRHGKDWKKISAAVGHKSPDMVKALYAMHRTFLSLPEHQATSMGFIALVTGHCNVLELSSSHRGNGQTIRASGKAKKHGEATQHKVHEAPHPHGSYHAGKIPGFSPSFKKRYYGELARNSQSHPVGNRTPRIPVIVPADRNAINDATPEFKNAMSSTKRNNDKINNDRANFSMNECSPDGRSGIMEATKGVECQALLETNGDTEICQTQQPLKKRRMDQTMDRGRASKVGHETMMEVKEENKPSGLLKQQMSSMFISADDILILDVLQSLVDEPDKMSKLKINITSNTLRKSDFTLSESKDEGHSPVDLSKQGKPITECSASKTKRKRHTKVPAEEINVVHAIDITEGSSNSDSARGLEDLPESTANIFCEVYPTVPREINPEISMSRRRKMKNKMHRKKKYVMCNKGSDNVEARKLLHCLSSEFLRRWCTYEWFYSAIDFPWFMDNEFVKYMNHPYLRHISRLARSEWSIIRSYRGKPRRFSDNFLVMERKQLEDYRKEVRTYYAQLSDGSLDSLPADVARPFSIGQQVIVRHPSSRELCDGKVVMVDQDCCKVQFDNPELGLDLVQDVDCMPVNWLDNLPDNVRSTLESHDVHNILEMEHVFKVTPSGNRDHTINEVSIPELPISVDITSDEQLEVEYSVDSERTQKESTSDGIVQSTDFPNNNDDHYDQLESYCSAFVRSMQSQAREMVDEVMQATSGGNSSQDEGAGAVNQATNCISPDLGAVTCDSQLPSNLIMNCTATVLAIKRLADSRHPPANIAGILQRFSAMLLPTCSENLAIYRDIEKHISIITSQTVALMPRTL
ncbi:hypothetical protein SETIT_9G308900v2 [Setaria italica]|uniref:SANT domain-containing protein n=1 Tax=Setaria italica TaxID=4555 RepID=A0A368SMP2_SETIT|nr:protein ALWAYS EARLY 1 isoform X1 [Setaria italica]XP_022678606.1 protein ALWAYS EARLY 1 isoform X1 [Setaria italica]RCV43624.1 hypothetical protein SETIT_9G308900v2 [Setaria italica]RCV43625.1 hypothetical protein SETIT_9G308900v2 [Setaria italica]